MSKEILEQSKNEIAKEYGYKDFYNYISSGGINEIYINKVSERYHELMNEWIDINDRLPSGILKVEYKMKDGKEDCGVFIKVKIQNQLTDGK
jgi:hypothetical protein